MTRDGDLNDARAGVVVLATQHAWKYGLFPRRQSFVIIRIISLDESGKLGNCGETVR